MWNRTRQMLQTPFLSRNGTNTPQVTPPMAQQNQTTQPEPTTGKEKKCSEPLFGPGIGPVSSGPAWTLSSEKKVLTDELTPDIVSSWIDKSKDVSSFLPEASQSKRCLTSRLVLLLAYITLGGNGVVPFYSFLLFISRGGTLQSRSPTI